MKKDTLAALTAGVSACIIPRDLPDAAAVDAVAAAVAFNCLLYAPMLAPAALNALTGEPPAAASSAMLVCVFDVSANFVAAARFSLAVAAICLFSAYFSATASSL